MIENDNIRQVSKSKKQSDYMHGPKIAVGVGCLIVVILFIVALMIIIPLIGSYINDPFAHEKQNIIN